MTAPIYSVMVPHLEWVYHSQLHPGYVCPRRKFASFQQNEWRQIWTPKLHQMSSRYWATYGSNNNRHYIQCIANTKLCFKIQNQSLLSGPPHPPRDQHQQQQQQQTGKSSTFTCISSTKYFMKWTSSTLCIMSTSCQSRFANQVNR